MKFTFSKEEKLCSRILIDRLFKKGSTEVQTYYLFPFRVLYIFDDIPERQSSQVLFSVSKRYFKKSVDRNLLKRRSREAYRLRHTSGRLHTSDRLPSYMAFLYLAKETQDFHVIEKAIHGCLDKIKRQGTDTHSFL